MRIIKTSKYTHDRGPSVDDQPGFKNRDVDGQGASILGPDDAVPESEDQIIKNWKKKQKTNKDEKDRIPKNSI